MQYRKIICYKILPEPLQGFFFPINFKLTGEILLESIFQSSVDFREYFRLLIQNMTFALHGNEFRTFTQTQ